MPIYTTRSSDLIPESPRGDYLWSVDLGQLVPSALVHEEDGDSLLVYLHGATDRMRHSMPRYERVRSFTQVGKGPVMFFSDPTLDLDSRMILSWFMGTERVNLHREMATMVDACARKYGVKHVVIVGNSGGGFGALQIASYLDHGEAIAVNAQIDMDMYTPRLSNQAAWACFGMSMEELNQSEWVERANVIERYGSAGFPSKVLMYQNIGDDHHYHRHFVPFREVFESEERDGRMVVEEMFQAPGHVAPTPVQYQNLVSRWISGQQREGRFYQGMI